MRFLILLLCFSQVCFGQDSNNVAEFQKDSLHKVFYANGEIFIAVPYLNGEQHGSYMQYHENGQLFFKKEMRNGKVLDGTYYELNEYGKIYRECYYKNGVEHGKWLAYDSNGKPWKMYIFRKGKCVKLKVWNEEKGKWDKTALY